MNLPTSSQRCPWPIGHGRGCRNCLPVAITYTLHSGCLLPHGACGGIICDISLVHTRKWPINSELAGGGGYTFPSPALSFLTISFRPLVSFHMTHLLALSPSITLFLRSTIELINSAWLVPLLGAARTRDRILFLQDLIEDLPAVCRCCSSTCCLVLHVAASHRKRINVLNQHSLDRVPR